MRAIIQGLLIFYNGVGVGERVGGQGILQKKMGREKKSPKVQLTPFSPAGKRHFLFRVASFEMAPCWGATYSFGQRDTPRVAASDQRENNKSHVKLGQL